MWRRVPIQVQFSRTEDQPVEYAGKAWDADKYPWQTVAKVIVPKQDSFIGARKSFWRTICGSILGMDSSLFSPWDHPTGSGKLVGLVIGKEILESGLTIFSLCSEQCTKAPHERQKGASHYRHQPIPDGGYIEDHLKTSRYDGYRGSDWDSSDTSRNATYKI